MVNGIVGLLKGLVGKARSALMGVVASIRSAIQAWITAAKSKVSTLISNITSPFSGVASTIASNLSGVASALLKPFTDAWSWIEPYYNKIKSALDIIPGSDAWAGEEANGRASLLDAYAGETANGRTSLLDTYTVNRDNSPLEVEHNLNINLDLSNVPAHIGTDDLIRMLSDRKVLSALTNNGDFQLLDGKAKERLNLKVNRARGV